MEHPDDSILLAYSREQALDESWSGIEQHIDTCEKCHGRSIEYRQISAELSETLAHFQRHQDYPSLTEGIFDLIENPGGRRERERRRRYLTGGLPFRPALVSAVALLLVLLFASIVFASRADWPYLGQLMTHQGQNSAVLPSAATVKSHTSQSAINQLGTNGSTGAVTPDRGPTIKMCTKSSDSDQSRARLCGNNFTPGEKVQVVIHLAGGGSRTLHSVLVDAQGHFQDTWIVASCKDVPTSIDVQGETNTTEASLDLRGNHHLDSALFQTRC
jgi:anti-sigma factor RsiW